MTRKDYVLLAVAFRSLVERAVSCNAPPDVRHGILLSVREVSAHLYADNPRFDVEQFKADCTMARLVE